MASTYSTLVNYSRLVSSTREPREVLHALAETSLGNLDADGVAVLQIAPEDGSASLVETMNIPETAQPRAKLTAITPDIADRIIAASAGRFHSSRTVPLVAHSNIYGALVLLYAKSKPPEKRVDLTEAICDLSSLALYSHGEFLRLRKTYHALKESKEALAHSEKLRLLGEQSATISHDLKNILQPIFTGAQMLQRQPASPDKIQKTAELMKSAAERGLDMVERLRLFSRNTATESAGPRDIRELIDEAVALCQPRIKKGTQLRVDHGQVSPVILKASDFVSSIVNLIVNANDAITHSNGLIEVISGTDPAGIWVKVKDNGPGIPQETREKIFQPFFSTKGEAGTGLGLSSVQSFVKDVRAKISLETEIGKGTTFTIIFPTASF